MEEAAAAAAAVAAVAVAEEDEELEADEGAGGAPPSATTQQQQHTFPGHYRRLQEIEKRVVHALEAASVVMAELAKERDTVDKQLLHAAATGFIAQVQEAQGMVLEAVQAAAPDREFEANNYFLMVQAMSAAEKLDAVSLHVSGLSKLLRQHHQQQQQPAAAGGAAAGSLADGGQAPEEDGAGAMVLDSSGT